MNKDTDNFAERGQARKLRKNLEDLFQQVGHTATVRLWVEASIAELREVYRPVAQAVAEKLLSEAGKGFLAGSGVTEQEFKETFKETIRKLLDMVMPRFYEFLWGWLAFVGWMMTGLIVGWASLVGSRLLFDLPPVQEPDQPLFPWLILFPVGGGIVFTGLFLILARRHFNAFVVGAYLFSICVMVVAPVLALKLIFALVK
jgi:hypothetical protein